MFVRTSVLTPTHQRMTSHTDSANTTHDADSTTPSHTRSPVIDPDCSSRSKISFRIQPTRSGLR